MANWMTNRIEDIGRTTVRGLSELGYIAALCFESLYWFVRGRKRNQPVRMAALFQEAVQIGIHAIPICAVLCFSIGVMLAIQGIQTLKTFGAESQVILGIALSVTREFSPLIISILIAGRSDPPSQHDLAPCMSHRKLMPCKSWALTRFVILPHLYCWP